MRLWLVVLAVGVAGAVRAEPTPNPVVKGKVGAPEIFAALTEPDHTDEIEALRALRDALDGSPDAQRLAAARSKLDRVLQAEERLQGETPPALVMSGIASRIETAIAGLETARPVPAPVPQDKLTTYLVPGLAAVSAALGVALLACLAGLAARGRPSEEAEELRETLKKIRRRLEGAGSAGPPGGLSDVASGEASDAVHQAAMAVDRLGAAAREAESRLEVSLGAAEARLHAAASVAGQLEQWVAALPERLAEAVKAMESVGLAGVEQAASRLETGVAPLDEIGFLLADHAGLTARAAAAALDLQGIVSGLEQKVDGVTGALPARVAALLQPMLGELNSGADLLGELSNLSIGQSARLEDIVARADKVAYDLPAVGQLLEAASAHLLRQIGQDAVSAACVNEAAEALDARLSRGSEALQARLEAGAGIASDLLAGRLGELASVLEGRLEASAKSVSESLAGELAEVANAVGARMSEGTDTFQARLESHAEAVSESLGGRLLQAADAVGARLAGRAELFQAGLEAGAGAIVDAASALPAIRDGLREVAVHLARETSTQGGTLAQTAKTLAAETAALSATAAQLRGDAAALSAVAARIAGDAAAPDAVPAAQIQIASVGLEAATETVQLAVHRLLESAATQEAALTRATQAAAEVARLTAAPEMRNDTDRIGLAGLNGLASLAEALHGKAESLAASVLRGETVCLPAELVSETPVMLAAIETSIHRLRGTATALALARDAQRKAA